MVRSYTSIILILSLAIIPCMPQMLKEEFIQILEKQGFSLDGDITPSNVFSDQPLQGHESACGICTIVVGLIQQYSDIHQLAIDDFIMNKFCGLFSQDVSKVCDEIVTMFGP